MRYGILAATISSRPVPLSLAYQYWRVFCLNTWGDDHFSLSNIEFRDAYGGPDLTVPGQPANIIYSSQFDSSSHAVVNAFDADPNSKWASAGAWSGHFIGWDFGEPIAILEVGLTPRTDGWVTQFSRDSILQASEDGVTWIDIMRFTTDSPVLGVEQNIGLPPTDELVISDMASNIVYGLPGGQDLLITDVASNIVYGLPGSEDILVCDVASTIIYSGA